MMGHTEGGTTSGGRITPWTAHLTTAMSATAATMARRVRLMLWPTVSCCAGCRVVLVLAQLPRRAGCVWGCQLLMPFVALAVSLAGPYERERYERFGDRDRCASQLHCCQSLHGSPADGCALPFLPSCATAVPPLHQHVQVRPAAALRPPRRLRGLWAAAAAQVRLACDLVHPR